MRPIDVDELKADLRMADDCKDCKTNARDCEYDRVYTKMDFCAWLDDALTVDAVPVRHGRWIPNEDENGDHYGDKCSECGEWYVMPFRKTNFCPNCGAKMDGEDGGEIDKDINVPNKNDSISRQAAIDAENSK